MSSVRHEIVFLPDEADEKRSRVECLVERMTKVMLWMDDDDGEDEEDEK